VGESAAAEVARHPQIDDGGREPHAAAITSRRMFFGAAKHDETDKPPRLPIRIRVRSLRPRPSNGAATPARAMPLRSDRRRARRWHAEGASLIGGCCQHRHRRHSQRKQ